MKLLSLLTCLALGAAACGAAAQSSVTLYGTIDVAARRTDTAGARRNAVDSSGAKASELGFTGREDLGGGLYAAFRLSADVFADTGTASALFFGRESWVSVGGGFGEIRFGRDYVPTFVIISAFDPFRNVGVGANGGVANFGLNTNAGVSTTVRASNGIVYLTPPMGGFFGRVHVAASEGVSGSGYRGVLAGYNRDKLRLMMGLGTAEVGVAGSTVNTGRLKMGGVNAAYDFGPVDLRLQYVRKDSSVGGGVMQSDLILSAVVPLGQHELKFKYDKVGQDFNASLAAVGYTYYLSKRTWLYANYGNISNKSDNARFSVAGAAPAVAGQRQRSSGAELGITHNF